MTISMKTKTAALTLGPAAALSMAAASQANAGVYTA